MAAIERPREMEALMKERARIDDEIARLCAVRSGLSPEIGIRARELSAKIREMFPCAQYATAWFDGRTMRVEIYLNNANTISRAEFRDGPVHRCGWVLMTCYLDRPMVPLAPIRRLSKASEEDAQKSLRDTMLAQQTVGRRAIEHLITLEEKYACCMFPDLTSPANYVQVRRNEDGLLSVEWE